jgi:Trp operon repressor
MAKTVTLDDQEWQLVIELLESEQKELPAEIHHTDSFDYRARISKRLEIVNKLLETLRKQ